MKTQSVVLRKVANRQTDKCRVKHNLLGGDNYITAFDENKFLERFFKY